MGRGILSPRITLWCTPYSVGMAGLAYGLAAVRPGVVNVELHAAGQPLVLPRNLESVMTQRRSTGICAGFCGAGWGSGCATWPLARTVSLPALQKRYRGDWPPALARLIASSAKPQTHGPAGSR
jgi:hypothetical protein